MERTLIILKPDALQRSLMGDIVHRLERRGLQFIGLKLLIPTMELAQEHYKVHRERDFYPGLIDYITSSPVVAGVVEGVGVVKLVRETVGATRPVEATPGSIRGDLAVDVGRNLIHASDSAENGAVEVALWFRDDELVSYQLTNERWIHG